MVNEQQNAPAPETSMDELVDHIREFKDLASKYESFLRFILSQHPEYKLGDSLEPEQSTAFSKLILAISEEATAIIILIDAMEGVTQSFEPHSELVELHQIYSKISSLKKDDKGKQIVLYDDTDIKAFAIKTLRIILKWGVI